MKLHLNIPVIIDGKEVRVTVEEYSRGGKKSPSLDIMIIDGKRYVPYAAKRAKIQINMNGIMKMLYSDSIKTLVYSNNPFLSLFRKN